MRYFSRGLQRCYRPGPGNSVGFPALISDDRLASLSIAGILLISALVVNPVIAVLVPGFLALVLLSANGALPVRRWISLAWRLKWFFVSLIFFFGWMQPSSGSQGWVRAYPSVTGLLEVGVRIAALILIVGWIAWFTKVFDRDAQVRGLVRWLSPLRPLGLRGEVFATRLFLSLDYFEAQRSQYLAFRARVTGTRWTRLMAGRDFMVARVGDALAGIPPEGPRTVVADPGRVPMLTRSWRLCWQVGLLWLALLLTVAIRLGLNSETL